MRFGESYEDVKKQPSGGAGGSFIKYPRDDDTRIRIIDEPEPTEDWPHGWVGWWEHFDQGMSTSYPCTGDRDNCPGCTSSNERTKKATRRVGFNVVMEKDGKHYVDYFKVTRQTAEKLENRAKLRGTITDRDYVIVKLKGADVVNYDVLDEDKEVVDLSEFRKQRKDPQAMLAAMWDEAWGEEVKAEDLPDPSGDSDEGSGNTPDPEIDRMKEKLRQHQAKQTAKAEEREAHKESFEKGDDEPPPSEPEAESDSAAEGEDEEQDPGEPELGLDELKAMNKGQLMSLIATEQKWGRLPKENISNLKKADMLAWLLEHSK